MWRDDCNSCGQPNKLGWSRRKLRFKCGACHDATEDSADDEAADDEELRNETRWPTNAVVERNPNPGDCGGWATEPTLEEMHQLAENGSFCLSSFGRREDDARQLKQLVIASDPVGFLFHGVAASVWAAAHVLHDYLLGDGSAAGELVNFGHSRPYEILELGAGCGGLGVALAARGHSVTLTDRAHTLPLLRYNVWRNGLTAPVAELRFGILNDLGNLPKLDLIIASDIIYDDATGPLLLKTLEALVLRRPSSPRSVVNPKKQEQQNNNNDETPPPRILLALARREGCLEVFLKQAAAAGWTATLKRSATPWSSASCVFVYELEAAAAGWALQSSSSSSRKSL